MTGAPEFDAARADDGSSDDTVRVARELGLEIFIHNRNYGYGANEKTCCREALRAGADSVMVHPDYQYDPTLRRGLIAPVVLGKPTHTGFAPARRESSKQGMPWWKYIANRFLTGCENAVFGLRPSEYHTGYHAFSREILQLVNFEINSDGFLLARRILHRTGIDTGPHSSLTS